MGYKVGLGEGYLRGRNIAKALKEAEAKRWVTFLKATRMSTRELLERV
jgi:hypothetical protein